MNLITPRHGNVVRFEDFRLDRHGGLARRHGNGPWAPVALGSRALDVLRVLLEQPGELVSKQTLIDVVWPGTTVEDSNLTVQLSALRRVLDERRPEGSGIQTVVGRGYRFLPAVMVEAAEGPRADPAGAPPAESAPRPSLVVLPFRSIGCGSELACLAETLTDDLTTDLSRGSHVSVVARAAGGPLDASRTGMEPGVDYAVQGSVRGTAERPSVNARLVDVEAGVYVWAERFDIDPCAVADIRDVSGRLARGLTGKLIEAVDRRVEARGPGTSLIKSCDIGAPED